MTTRLLVPPAERVRTMMNADLTALVGDILGQPPMPPISGGDRQLNRALHTVVLHRRQHDPATKDYIARRVAEGKSRREATRLLKRYVARSLYRLLQAQEPLMA